ncbi:MAG: LTA synthase family protein [Clostridiaceae bacterium]|nr:LTA synthase family protein [Clostridiaceae bacterium]
MVKFTTNKYRRIAAIAFTVILIISLIACFDVFVDHTSASYSGQQSRTTGNMAGDVPLSQTFKPEKAYLSYIEVRIATYNNTNSAAMMHFKLLNDEGDVLAQSETPIADIKDDEYVRFSVEQRLDPSKLYSYTLKIEGLGWEKAPMAWVSLASKNAQKTLVNPGDLSEKPYQINSQFGYEKLNLRAFFAALGLAMLCGLSLMTEIKLGKRAMMVAAAATLLVVPFLVFFIAELLNDWSFFDKENEVYVVNYLFYLLIFTFVFSVINRLCVSAIVSSVLVYTVAVINYFKLLFRGEPVQIWDIVTVRTALNVSGEYPLRLSSVLVVTFLSLLLLSFLLVRVRFSLKKFRSRALVNLSCFALASMLVVSLFNTDRYSIAQNSFMQSLGITNNVWNQPSNYKKNGLLLGITMNAQDLLVEVPEGYSAQAVVDAAADIEIGQGRSVTRDELQRMYKRFAVLDTYENLNAEMATTKPNIIVIMNESFADLTDVAPFETDEKVLEFIPSLKENTISGDLFVSTYGGGTANSEFEFLTSHSMTFLPTGSIPYLQYVNESTSSLPKILKAVGYQTVAIHPYEASGWNRPEVYEDFAFDRFMSVDDFKNPDYLRSYVSDEDSYAKVVDTFERKTDGEPIFIFNVTMQNHGGYGKTYDNINYDIKLSDYPGMYPETEQYLSVVKSTDDATRDLIEYFSQQDEPTIICFFGDHLPSMKNGFYDEILGRNISSLDSETMQKLYATEYFIWANYDIEEVENKDLSLNYLSTMVLDVAGIDMPLYNIYLKEMMAAFPIVTPMGIFDKDGVRYDCVSAVSDDSEWFKDYANFVYNDLFDDKNHVTGFFEYPMRTEPSVVN